MHASNTFINTFHHRRIGSIIMTPYTFFIDKFIDYIFLCLDWGMNGMM